MRRILTILAFVGSIAHAETARLTRYLERGDSEGYALTCDKDGCRVDKLSGDEAVATKKVDKKTAAEIVEHFFKDLPKGEVKKLPLPEANFPKGMILSWHAANGERYAEGALTRKQAEASQEPAGLEAALALEGRLLREVRK